MNKPVMYGRFHILFALSAYIVSILLAHRLEKVPAAERIRVLAIIGWCMLAAEAVKQIYLTVAVHQGEYDWFHFPFQLCSMPMYLCAFLPLIKRYRHGAECFLFSFGLFAASAALAYPQDMLSSDLFLLLHSFIYHGLMLFIAFWIMMSEKLEWAAFLQALVLFLLFSGTAEVINCIGHYCGGNPDMFYISPFMPASQPVFRNIATVFGRPFEIVFYLLCIIGAAALIFYIYRIIMNRKRII